MRTLRFVSALVPLLAAVCFLAPLPAQEKAKNGGNTTKDVDTLHLILGEPRLLILHERIFKIALEDNAVAEYGMIRPTQITLMGKAGQTTLVLHVGDPGKGNVGRLELKLVVLGKAEGAPAEPARTKIFQKHVARVVDPEKFIELKVKGTHGLKFQAEPKRVQLSSRGVVDYEFTNPKQMELRGVGAGTAILNVWIPDKNEKIGEKVLSMRIRVAP
jgi:hypothetical protein